MKRRVSKGGSKKSKKHLGKKSKKHVGKKSRKHNKTKRSAKKGGVFFSSKIELPKGEHFGWWLYVSNDSRNIDYQTKKRIIGEINNRYITASPNFFEEEGNYTYTGAGFIGTRDTIYLNDKVIPALITLSYDKVYKIKEGQRVIDNKNFVIQENEHKTFGFF